MWLLLAFTGPVLWAASTHIDKYLVDRFFKHSDTAVLMVFTALIGVLMLPLIAAFESGVFSIKGSDMAITAGSGVLYMGAMLLYLRAIQAQEASVIAPLFQMSTLFTFLLAWLLLGETLDAKQAAGAALIIVGALAVSIDRSFHLRAFTGSFVGAMIGATFVLALSSVLFKLFAVRDKFWVTTFWINVGQSMFGIGILAIPHYRRQFLGLFRKSPGAVMAINGANELINLGGGLGVRAASLLAPVALVSAVSSTTTLLVFLFGIALTLFAPRLGREDLSWQALAQKAASAALVAGGVALLGGPQNP
jgi:drug/metabolite transporter (DMT)-like permease